MSGPSEGMEAAFVSLPQWVLWPSYRTPLTLVMFAASAIIIYPYVAFANLVHDYIGPLLTKRKFNKAKKFDESNS
jgi:hypothetical protein